MAMCKRADTKSQNLFSLFMFFTFQPLPQINHNASQTSQLDGIQKLQKRWTKVFRTLT